jgi:glutamine synthetase
MGQEFSLAYIKLKHDEWNAYASEFSTWERRTALDV